MWIQAITHLKYLGREYMARISVGTPTAMIEAFSGVLQVFEHFVD
jgi:hypothetical protein